MYYFHFTDEKMVTWKLNSGLQKKKKNNEMTVKRSDMEKCLCVKRLGVGNLIHNVSEPQRKGEHE